MHSPSVSVVIVNYNGFELSKECIESVLKVEYENFNIVLIDNGSADDSGLQLDDFFKGKIIYKREEINKGVTGGNNSGIKIAQGLGSEYVLFLNNDTIVESNLISGLIDPIKGQPKSMAIPKIKLFYLPDHLDHWLGTGFNWKTGKPEGFKMFPKDSPEYNERQTYKICSTCCLLAPCGLFDEIGLMDEEYFMYYDDADFTLRAANAGYSIQYEPQVEIIHKSNMTTGKESNYFQLYLMFRNELYFYRKLCPSLILRLSYYFKWVVKITAHFVSGLCNKKGKVKAIKSVVRDVARNRMGIPSL